MCGPYVALCAARLAPGPVGATPNAGTRILFNVGRLATYATIGTLVGALGQIALAAGARAQLGGVVALAAGSVAVVFGVSLVGWIRDPSAILNRLGVDVLIRGELARLSARLASGHRFCSVRCRVRSPVLWFTARPLARP